MLSTISLTDTTGIIAICIALFLGGILKGATGVGMPIIAVPVIAAFYDVRLAVIILVIPNLLSNLWQVNKFKSHNHEPKFTRNFALSGFIGAAVGTLVLAWVPVEKLNILMALVVFAYITLRVARPEFHLPLERAKKLVGYAGFGGGVLQGALGISAPIAVTFANAIRLDRPVFIFTISAFFTSMCLAQLPMQYAYGMVNWNTILIGLIAFLPLVAGLQVGEIVGKRMNPIVFDRVILAMLAVLALKQIIDVIF